ATRPDPPRTRAASAARAPARRRPAARFLWCSSRSSFGQHVCCQHVCCQHVCCQHVCCQHVCCQHVCCQHVCCQHVCWCVGPPAGQAGAPAAPVCAFRCASASVVFRSPPPPRQMTEGAVRPVLERTTSRVTAHDRPPPAAAGPAPGPVDF